MVGVMVKEKRLEARCHAVLMFVAIFSTRSHNPISGTPETMSYDEAASKPPGPRPPSH